MYNPIDFLYTQRCANATNILYTQHFLLKIRNFKISSFCYAHKRPSPFFLYIPTKKPSFQRYSMNLLSNSCQPTGKKSENGKKPAHPQTPLPRLRKNFFYYCDTIFSLVSTKCAKKIEPRISVPFVLELEYESKIIKKF